MTRIAAIASNTFRETIRNKILYVILVFALVVIGLSWFLADLSVGDFARIIANIGLAAIHVFGVVMAVFLGITLVNQEVERRTVYVVLSKPVPRWEFVVGKGLGLSATLLLTTAVMAGTLFVLHAAYAGAPERGILVASAGIYLELVLLVCIASLFSTFTTPILSATFTLFMFLIGHVSGSLHDLGGRSKSPTLRLVSQALYYFLPNLEIFNWKNEVVYGKARSLALVGWSAGYLVAYGAAVLALACLLFSRKDFK